MFYVAKVDTKSDLVWIADTKDWAVEGYYTEDVFDISKKYKYMGYLRELLRNLIGRHIWISIMPREDY